MKRFIPIIIAAVVLAPMFFTSSCANTTKAPSGGPKDTIPPVIRNIRPLPGATNFPTSGGKIAFTFDEYTTIKNLQSIYLSPPQKKAPKAKIKGKDLVVYFEEDLEPNTTYTLNLNDAIADNNEGNIFPGFTYVFSTGDKIDNMFMTGVVLDCNTLEPVKGATAMLYKDSADSAIFKSRPYAAAKTDDWGFFVIPYIQDTLYRLYAIKDASNNNIYDPDEDLIAFIDSTIRPKYEVGDSIPELLKYDMTDTLGCEARRVEHELKLFREKPSKQFLKNKERPGLRSAYVTFQAPNAWVDSVWIGGYRPNQVITQFNILQDSLEIWLNDRRSAPDTMHLFVNYRKTDSTGLLVPDVEHLKLTVDSQLKKKYSRANRRNLKHEDTICVYKLSADGATVEQNGFELIFDNPIIYEGFDSLKFRYLNPKQKEFTAKVSVEQDSLNLRRYIIRPDVKYQTGYEYFLKVPYRSFRDINGYYCDSTEVKVSLPTDETLSTLQTVMRQVKRKYIVDLLDEKRDKVLRSYIIDKDQTLTFPYLKEGRYCLRVTEDINRNSIVDTGNLLEHRQPERVVYVEFKGGAKFINIPPSSEVSQEIYFNSIFDE